MSLTGKKIYTSHVFTWAQLFVGRLALNPGFNFNLGFFFFYLTTFYWIIFSTLYRASSHQIVDGKNLPEFVFLAFLSLNSHSH